MALKLSRFAAIVLLCSVAAAPSGCRLFSKSNLSSATKRSLHQKEIDRLRAEFKRIKELFPQPEFQEIAQDIYARFTAIYEAENPEKELRKPALMYVLNSLPGSGKTFFVQEVAKALDLVNDDRNKTYELSPSDLYLDFSKINKFAATLSDVAKVRNGGKIKPVVLLYDEYTMAATLAGTGQGDIRAALQAVKQQLKDHNFLRYSNDLEKLYSELAPRWNETTQLNSLISNLKTIKGEFSSIHATTLTRIDTLLGTKSRSETELEELRRKSADNFTTFWAARGNGVLPRVGGKSNTNVESTLKNSAEVIAKEQLKYQTAIAKKIIFNMRKARLDAELQEQVARDSQASRTGRRKTTEKDSASEQSDDATAATKSSGTEISTAQQNIIDQINKISELIDDANEEISNVDESIADLIEDVQSTFTDIIAPSITSTVAEVAKDLGIGFGELRNKQFEENVTRIATDAGISAEDALKAVREQQQSFDEISSQLSAADVLLALFTKKPLEFYNYYVDVLARQSGEGDKMTGNVVIFLAGNLLSVQKRILAELSQQGPTLCEKLGSGIPSFNDPDCLLLITEKVIKEPDSIAEMQQAVERVLGKNEGMGVEQNQAMELNALATQSRIGAIKFIKPLSGENYRMFIRRDLDALSKKFESHVKFREPGSQSKGVSLVFEDNVVEDFLYRRFVNAHLGLRNLADKARNYFAFTLDAEVSGLVAEYNKASSMLGSTQCNVAANGQKIIDRLSVTFDSAALEKKPIKTVIVRFQKTPTDSTGSILFDAITTDNKRTPIYSLKIRSAEEIETPKAGLSKMQRVTYASYIGALYGSMASLYRTVPTEPIMLGSSPSGVPVVASKQQPFGYDMTEFRNDFMLFNIEIQANIAALAGFESIASGYDPPPELKARKETILNYIGSLWDQIQAYRKTFNLSFDSAVNRPINSNSANPSPSKVDPILQQFSALSKVSRDQSSLTDSEREEIFTRVFEHFREVFAKQPKYTEIMNDLTLMILANITDAENSKTQVASIEPQVIQNLLSNAQVDLVTEPGAPGFDRCPAYLKSFGVAFPVETSGDDTPANAARAQGIFGMFAERAAKDWAKTRAFLKR